MSLFRDFLTNLDKYDENNIKNETIGGLMLRIAQRVNTLFGLKTEDVLKEVAHGSASDAKARQMGKVATGSFRVSGTPTLRINGVKIDNGYALTAEQLADLIRSLFSDSEKVFVN